MSNGNELISKIIDLEWKMFQGVNNRGGRASCQDDFATFEVMRRCQALSWSEECLASYLDDLVEAGENGRNLVTEKYARMMKSTHPDEYRSIEAKLPALDPETEELVSDIVGVVLPWEDSLAARYPFVVERGRPIRSSEDSASLTSVETYLRGEILTYSKKTLTLYRDHAFGQRSLGVNGSEIIMANMMTRYGFESLESANEKMAEARAGRDEDEAAGFRPRDSELSTSDEDFYLVPDTISCCIVPGRGPASGRGT
jgi:hypothetical protein